MFHHAKWMRGVLWSGLVAAVVLGAENSFGVPPSGGPNEVAGKRGVSRGVQLLPSTPELAPNTTFELRFDDPIVRAEEVGMAAKESPLVIKPPLPGQFVWLSRRSGLFTPAAAPALATTYQFSLRPDLRDAEGRPSRARLAHTLATPAFGVVRFAPNGTNANLPVEPLVVAQFNAAVNPAVVSRYVRFRGPAGLQVPAAVRAQTRDELYLHNLYPDDDEGGQTWGQSFVSADSQPGARLPSYLHLVQRSNATNREVPHRLIIQPAKPLTPGAGWRLVLEQGLPDATGKLRMPAARQIPLGDVQPFVVMAAEADNVINRGREIRLTFSKELAANLTNEVLQQHIHLVPAPPALRMELAGRQVVIRGQFELETNYVVTVLPGLPAREPLWLTQPFQQAFQFQPLKPRLYLPAFNDDQLADGRRQLELLAVNVNQVYLRAKRFEPQTVIHALRGYRSYFKSYSWEDPNNEYPEPYQRLDYNLVPGQTVAEFPLVIKSTVDEPARQRLNWDNLLGQRRHGVVFLQAEGYRQSGPNHPPQAGVQAIVQVTDLGVVWKTAGDKGWVMVFSYATGQPVPGATVKLLTDESVTLAEGVTDAHGVATLNRMVDAQWLMAVKGDDLHALALKNEYQSAIPLYRFNIPYAWGGEEEAPVQALLFSDRSVYRPGETVHLKALARRWDGAGWQLPPERAARLILTDSRARTILATNLALSALGSLDLSAVLPAAPLGPYQVRLDLPPSNTVFSAYHHFYVQEIQPNAFEVLLAAKPAYGPEEPFDIGLSARYYLGQPLTRAQVRWTLAPDYFFFAPEGFGDFRFGAAGGTDHGLLPVTGEVELNGQESVRITPLLTNAAPTRPVQYNLLAEVTDLNQQTISAQVGWVRHSSDFYLGLRQFKTVLPVGEAVPVQVVAANANGSPRPVPVSFHARLVKVTWRTVAKEGAGKTLVYENQREDTVVKELDGQTVPVRKAGINWEPVSEVAPMSFTPPEPGEYFVAVTARDDTGHTTVAEQWFSVTGPAKVGWNYRNAVQIELVPDKRLYTPGETATVLVKTPISGYALVTVERESVLRSFVVELQGNAPAVRVPLEGGDAPNVFVSVMMLRGIEKSPKAVKMPEMRIGYCQLNVERLESRLTALITSFVVPPSGGPENLTFGRADIRPPEGGTTNAYEPRQEVEVVAEIRDGLNRPAPDTEVTLYAVDEGFLSLTAYEAPNPHAFFHRTRVLAVFTSFSLPNLLPEDPELASFHNKGFLIGGGGAAAEARKNFLPCAFWSARLMTDANGRVRTRFTVPDSLTRYRIIAVAHNARQQFGGGTGAFEVNKPLMLTPSLPLFANVGDRLQARAVALNLTDADGEIEVTLQTDDKAVAEMSVTNVLVKAGRSAAIELPVKMKAPGKSQWLWRARFKTGPSFTDTVQSTLTVGYAQPLLREILARRVGRGETNLLAGADPRLLEGQGTVTVRLAATRLAEVGEASEHLLHYPYGCIEQTCSSLLPWLVLSQHSAGRTILARSPLNREEAIACGLNRIWSMQTPSGGLSYWPGGAEPMVWASAYGGLTLALLQRTGYEIPADRLKALGDYLSTQVRGAADLRQQDNLSDRCLALLTLAMLRRPEPAYHEALFVRRNWLTEEDRAILALAILEANGAKAMASQLLTEKTTAKPGDTDWFGCTARVRAAQVLAWTRCQPDNPQLEELLDSLVADQTDGHWLTTQGNAWGLWALADYARLVEGELKPTRAVLRFGGQEYAIALGGEVPLVETNFAFPNSRISERPLTPAPAPGGADGAQPSLTLINPESTSLRARTILEVRPQNTLSTAEDRGFVLRRSYHRLDDQNRPQDLKNLQPGDRVLVTLQLKLNQPAHYVAVDDPLPALFEPIQAQFVTQQTALAVDADEWFWDYREVRRDRVLYFRDHLPRGTYIIQHLARVRALGAVTAPAAKVEEMYQPRRFGLSGAQAVKIPAKPAPVEGGL